MRFKFTEHVSDILSFHVLSEFLIFLHVIYFHFRLFVFLAWSWSTSTSDPVTPTTTRQSVLCARFDFIRQKRWCKKKKLTENVHSIHSTIKNRLILIFFGVYVYTLGKLRIIRLWNLPIRFIGFDSLWEQRVEALNERKNEKKNYS